MTRYKRHRENLRKQVLKHYGNKCKCCKITNSYFLTLDHVNNDGHIFRKKYKGRVNSIYSWIISQNYPDDIQILCWNCNAGKSLNGGICPHKDKR